MEPRKMKSAGAAGTRAGDAQNAAIYYSVVVKSNSDNTFNLYNGDTLQIFAENVTNLIFSYSGRSIVFEVKIMKQA